MQWLFFSKTILKVSSSLDSMNIFICLSQSWRFLQLFESECGSNFYLNLFENFNCKININLVDMYFTQYMILILIFPFLLIFTIPKCFCKMFYYPCLYTRIYGVFIYSILFTLFYDTQLRGNNAWQVVDGSGVMINQQLARVFVHIVFFFKLNQHYPFRLIEISLHMFMLIIINFISVWIITPTITFCSCKLYLSNRRCQASEQNVFE